MKAAVLARYGGVDALSIRDVATPTPRRGEVRIRVCAASVNDWDWGMVRGKPLLLRVSNGFFAPRVRIVGCDVAGYVDAVGSGVSAYREGDAVFGDLCMAGFGAFAEYVCAPARAVARKPAAMTFEQAAAIPQAGMLAVQALIDVGHLRAGVHVLFNGAGGGVGTLGLQIAKLHGARVTMVDKAQKLDRLRALGADWVIDYATTDFTDTGESYDLIVDAKTQRSPFAYLRVLRPNGIYASVGGTMPRIFETWLVAQLIRRRTTKQLRVVALRPNKDLGYLKELFEAGHLVPVIDRTYRLDEVRAAFQRFARADHFGKVIITTE